VVRRHFAAVAASGHFVFGIAKDDEEALRLLRAWHSKKDLGDAKVIWAPPNWKGHQHLVAISGKVE
jgi:hypothetical protein